MKQSLPINSTVKYLRWQLTYNNNGVLMKYLKSNHQKGSVLPVVVAMSFIGMTLVMSFYAWAMHRDRSLNIRIAKTKAIYNAES